MSRLVFHPKYRDPILCGILLLGAAALVCWPQACMESVRDGLKLCGNVIVPSLFPFFVLSSLVVELGMSRYLGRLLEPVMAPLFRVNGACAPALALGFVGGYPVGARTAISLYENGQCSKTEAERLLAFCNNSGPAFILGVVGAGVFGSGAVGLVLYLTHILASLLVGILFRFYKGSDRPRRSQVSASFQTARFAPAFTRSVTGALASTLNICAFVLFFTVVLRALSLSGVMSLLTGLLSALFAPLGLTRPWCQRLLTGILEISSGVSSLTGQGGMAGRMSMAAFLLGWAGLSVHCQVLSFLGDSGLSIRTYFAGKFLHGGLSAALTALLVRRFPLSEPVSSYLAEQVETIAGLDFGHALTLSSLTAWGMWAVFVALCVHIVKNNTGKTRHPRV